MPIRFRCVYCDKLLGIAQRKAGLEITCPKCKGRMRVPTPESGSTATATAVRQTKSSVLEMPALSVPTKTKKSQPPTTNVPSPAKLFENDDFDKLLSAGTLPQHNGDGSIVQATATAPPPIQSTPGIEKLATPSEKSDRELFAIDLDDPNLSFATEYQFDSESPRAAAVIKSTNWFLLISSSIFFFACGILVGYFVLRKV